MLAKMNKTLERVEKKAKKMRVGAQMFEINDKDPIFFLSSANKKKIKTASCVSCANHYFDSDSEMLFCEFCGHSNCENCLYKERMFPKGKIDADG